MHRGCLASQCSQLRCITTDVCTDSLRGLTAHHNGCLHHTAQTALHHGAARTHRTCRAQLALKRTALTCRGVDNDSCPRCTIPAANLPAHVHTLCTQHQLDVLVVENMAKDAAQQEVVAQICTPHRPFVLGAPPLVTASVDDAAASVLGVASLAAYNTAWWLAGPACRTCSPPVCVCVGSHGRPAFLLHHVGGCAVSMHKSRHMCPQAERVREVHGCACLTKPPCCKSGACRTSIVVVVERAGARWSHTGWALTHWALEGHTKWTAAGLSTSVLLDQVQALASAPPVYVWQQPQQDGATHAETAAVRAALSRVFGQEHGRGAVRMVDCPAEAFEARVEAELQGLVVQEDAGAALDAAPLPWATGTPGATLRFPPRPLLPAAVKCVPVVSKASGSTV